MIKSFKKAYLLFLSFTMSLSVFGQGKTYKYLMDDVAYNFYEVVDSAEAYFDIHGTGKGSGWKGYQRWKNENESKFYPTGDRKQAYYSGAQHSYQTLNNGTVNSHAKALENGWEELGPWDANNITTHYSPGIGRVETFWVNPLNTDHIFLGSRSGGFWRTMDGGKNWENTTDTLVVSGVVSIAVNPFDIKDVLIAIQQGGNANTHGIYRSLDGGTTWVETKFNPRDANIGGLGKNQRIYKLAFHPTRKGLVYIGTSNGMYRSKNDLQSWSQVFSGYGTDIEFHPTKSNVVYAYSNYQTGQNYLKYSSDTGATWNNSALISNNNNAKLFISVSKNQPNNVYVASSNGIWRSKNQGAFFTFLSNPDESCQGFAVSDLDVKNMLYGYVDTEASSDEGQTFTQVTKWSNRNAAYVHADIRTLECMDGVFYIGTDGYLAKSSDNGKTWTRLNDGTAIREFYAVGLSQSNIELNIAGSQDNGTSILEESGWIEWNGGDGMEGLVQTLNSDWLIGSWQYGSRNYTRDGGQTRKTANNPRRGSGQANWEAPLLMDPLHQFRLYHFADTIYSSDDFGITWEFYSAPEIGQVKDAAIAQNNPDIIAISRNSTIRLTTDAGKTWSDIRSNLPNYSVTDIEFDPTRDSTIVVTYNRYQKDNQKIFISNDLGKTWSNITYNLVDMPLRTVTIDQSDSSYLYVGGEIGVYYKSLNGTEWKLYNENFPNVTVKDLEIHYGSNTLRAATWGRGLWENTTIGKATYPRMLQTSITETPSDRKPRKGLDQFVTTEIESSNGVKSAKLRWSKNNISLSNEIELENVSGNVWKSKTGIPSENDNDNMYFQLIVESNSNQVTESFRFHYVVRPFVYCLGRGGAGTGADWINHVELEEINNTTIQEYYGDYTDKVANLMQNHTYSLEMKLNFHFDLNKIAAWIDYNKNAEFDADEKITMGTIDGSHGSIGQFTVPSDVVLDDSLRLRVVCRYTSNEVDPCGLESGEVEDYTVIISKDTLSSIKTLNVLNAKVYPNPNDGTFTIELDKDVLDVTVTIYDNAGKLVYTQALDSKGKQKIKSKLTTGIYVLEITSNQGVKSQKLIVE
ncbi:MAG: photosystem II stability/assembly factor-like uncharacterized protein [Bacteroidia bacterium]|jgi:photosystem II stability/assembly factor-like uncharacterized protein